MPDAQRDAGQPHELNVGSPIEGLVAVSHPVDGLPFRNIRIEFRKMLVRQHAIDEQGAIGLIVEQFPHALDVAVLSLVAHPIEAKRALSQDQVALITPDCCIL
ncbi:MAG: hypothetical protein J0H16_08500 [Alicycliphilus denitrificans]|nr:hypothetical protein [Alicycliphilus denitrificans]